MIQRLAREELFLKTAQLFRIALLVWLGLHSILLLPFHETIFGPHAYVMRTRFDGSIWSWIFHLGQHSAVGPYYLWFFVVQLGAIALGILGIWPRLMMILAYVSTMNIYNLSGVILDGGNNLSQLLLFYMMLVNTSGRPSGPGWLGTFTRALSNGAFIMCRLQIAIVYLTAGLLKLQGHLWQNGMALYYLFQSETYGHPWIAQIMRKWPMFSLIGTYTTLAFQYLFPLGIWLRRWRKPLIIVGCTIHLGIAFGMGLFTFGLVMCVSYISFFPEDWSERVLQYMPTDQTLVIAFDEQCAVCMRFASLVSVLDWRKLIIMDRAHDPKDIRLLDIPLDQRLTRIQALDGARNLEGFDAILELLRRVPLLLPCLPLGLLLRFTGWGQRFYDYLATRSWRQSCRNGACAMDVRGHSRS